MFLICSFLFSHFISVSISCRALALQRNQLRNADTRIPCPSQSSIKLIQGNTSGTRTHSCRDNQPFTDHGHVTNYRRFMDRPCEGEIKDYLYNTCTILQERSSWFPMVQCSYLHTSMPCHVHVECDRVPSQFANYPIASEQGL